MPLFCNLIPRNRVNQEPCDSFYKRLKVSHHAVKFRGHSLFGIGNIMILKDHLIK